jgi:outer membrane protein, multidrug efflux system
VTFAGVAITPPTDPGPLRTGHSNRLREASDALVGYRKTREQRSQQERLVQAQADSATLANTLFVGGIDGYLQVLNAERQLFDAELKLTGV